MNSVQPWMYSEIKCNFCNRLHKKEDDKNFLESLKGTVAQEKGFKLRLWADRLLYSQVSRKWRK